jgi:hypothetical protein
MEGVPNLCHLLASDWLPERWEEKFYSGTVMRRWVMHQTPKAGAFREGAGKGLVVFREAFYNRNTQHTPVVAAAW